MKLPAEIPFALQILGAILIAYGLLRLLHLPNLQDFLFATGLALLLISYKSKILDP